MVEDAACEGGFVLGIGGGEERPKKRSVKFHILFPTHSEKIGEWGKELDNRSSSRIYSLDEGEEVGNKLDVYREERKRKKLRLSKEQLSLLEDSFNEHRTLTPAQKQELADRLNLSPRQVEVWFQNRRARTKMRQTEVDCEFLKNYCESLREENRRLKKELIELRSMKLGSPLYVHLPRGPAADKPICLYCRKVSPKSRKNSNTFHGAAKDASMAC